MKENRIKKFLKNENLIIIVIVIAVSIFTFYIQLNIGDELWNFSNIYKMTNGETIYKDCNVILTPLFFYIGEILFKILSANYLTFRIYNLIIYTAIYFLSYKILREIGIKRKNATIYLFIIFFITCKIILVGANYNKLAIVFVLIGILLILKNKYNNPLTQGIIIFLIFMTKQTIGVFYCIGIVIYNLFSNKDIKTRIITNIKTIGVFIVLFLIFCIYLMLNNNLYNFVNYTILGLLEFNRNIYFDNYIYLYSAELILSINIFLSTLLSKKNEDIKDKNIMFVLATFSILILLNAYPIFNKGHILISSFIPLLLIIYLIDKIIKKIWLKIENKKIHKAIDLLKNLFLVCSILYVTIYSVLNNYLYVTSLNNIYEPYYGAIIENKEEIDLIIQYIKEEEAKEIDVKILSCDANLYNNILKRNNGDIDLPFYGNLGYDGKEKLIKEISNMKNTNILISKDSPKFQEVTEVINYVRDNYEIIGEIGEYDIYKIGY